MHLKQGRDARRLSHAIWIVYVTNYLKSLCKPCLQTRAGPWFTNHPSFVNHACKPRPMVDKPWLTSHAHRPQRCPMALPSPRCQDVKMSGFGGGHLMAREMSRCQDVWTGVCGSWDVWRFLWHGREMSRCQDVQNGVGGSWDVARFLCCGRKMSRCLRCQDVCFEFPLKFKLNLNSN